MKQATQQLFFRCLWTSYDYLSATKEQDDIVVGGVVDFQMYHYPEVCVKKTGWVMRGVLNLEERLKNIPFPDPNITIVDNPVKVFFNLPDYVYMSKDVTNVKIGVWDKETETWNIDKIGGDCENKGTRIISFLTNQFAPMAML